jgi:hypothetical protein
LSWHNNTQQARVEENIVRAVIDILLQGVIAVVRFISAAKKFAIIQMLNGNIIILLSSKEANRNDAFSDTVH